MQGRRTSRFGFGAVLALATAVASLDCTMPTKPLPAPTFGTVPTESGSEPPQPTQGAGDFAKELPIDPCGHGGARKDIDIWVDKTIHVLSLRGVLPVPKGINTIRVSPSFEVRTGHDPNNVVILARKTIIQLEGARPLGSCEDWQRFGLRHRRMDNELLFSSHGTYERPTERIVVGAMLLVPPGIATQWSPELYGSVENPKDRPSDGWVVSTEVEEPWQATPLSLDPSWVHGLFANELDDAATSVDVFFKPRRGRPSYNWLATGTRRPDQFPEGNSLKYVHPTTGVSAEEIFSLLESRRRDFYPCLAALRSTYPSITGEVPTSFSIRGNDGTVDVVHMHANWLREDRPTMRNRSANLDEDKKKAATCFEAQLRRWKFPIPTDGLDVVVVDRMEFDVNEGM